MDENKTNEQNKKEEQNPNKITFLEIFVLILLVIAIGLYVSPNFLLDIENRKNAQIQTNASVFTSKALAEFSAKDKKAVPSKISEALAKELNAVNSNPYSKKAPAYSIVDRCEGCVIILPDDKMNSITVEAYSTDDIILVRTVIQPPSFVTYTRDLTSFDKQENKEKNDNTGK